MLNEVTIDVKGQAKRNKSLSIWRRMHVKAPIWKIGILPWINAMKKIIKYKFIYKSIGQP